VTRPSLREYAAGQRERYLAATRAEKGAQLDEGVAGTGRHRKAAIRLLRRAPQAPTARSRAGRPRRYGPAVAAAVEVLWRVAARARGRCGPGPPLDPRRRGSAPPGAYRDRARLFEGRS
jgi:hypothetical protein